VSDWRDATKDEMKRWPTLATLKKHFGDARLVPDESRGGPGCTYFKYQVKEAK
jgi:hypothetical protein